MSSFWKAVAEADWAVVWATFAGPIVAVALTLVFERRRESRGRREHLLRTLLNTHFTAADPAFQFAINSVRMEFGGDAAVIEKWEAYTRAAALQQVTDHVAQLIKAMMIALGYKATAADQALRNMMVTRGFELQQALQHQALAAVVALAESSARSAAAAEAMVARLAEQDPAANS